MTKPNKITIKLMQEMQKGCDKAIKELKKEPLKNSKQLELLSQYSLCAAYFEKYYDAVIKVLGNKND